MRKKSHISLAGQIMDSMELDNVFGDVEWILYGGIYTQVIDTQ